MIICFISSCASFYFSFVPFTITQILGAESPRVFTNNLEHPTGEPPAFARVTDCVKPAYHLILPVIDIEPMDFCL